MTALDQLTDRIALILDPDALDPVAQEQARNVAEAVIGMVVPLEWESPCAANNHIYQAHAPWGTYAIHICGGRHQAWLEAHEQPYERWLGDFVGSVLEAQEVANAHYRAQILAALGLDAGEEQL